MSTKPPTMGFGFGSDEEMQAELDAWDATFDAIQERSEPAPSLASTETDSAERGVAPSSQFTEPEADLFAAGVPEDDADLDLLTGDITSISAPINAPPSHDRGDLVRSATEAGASIDLQDEAAEKYGQARTTAASADPDATMVASPVAPPRDSIDDFSDIVSSAPPPPPAGRAKRVTALGEADMFGEAPTRMVVLDKEALSESARANAVPTRTGPAVVRREVLERRREQREAGENPDAFADSDANSRVLLRSDGVVDAVAQDTVTPSRGIDMAEYAAAVDETFEQSAEPNAEEYEDDYDIEIVAPDSEDAIPAPIEPLGEGSGAIRRLGAHVLRRGSPHQAVSALQRATEAAEKASEPSVSSPELDIPLGDVRSPSEHDFSDLSEDIEVEIKVVAAAELGVEPATGGKAAVAYGLGDVLDGLGDDDSIENASRPTPVPTGDDDSTPELVAAQAQALGAYASVAELPQGRVKTPTAVPPLAFVQSVVDKHRERRQSGPPMAAPPKRVEPGLDLERLTLPDQVGAVAVVEDDETCGDLLEAYERELEAIDDQDAAASLRLEAGRLAEQLRDRERARGHYEAALLADPREIAAMRGLRRIARADGELEEASRHLDAELGVAGSLERRALSLRRVDLLMAVGDQDQARVAVGELLDGAPSDVRALLANLELSFLDGRSEEFDESLRRLGDSIADPGIRSAVRIARGHLAERQALLPAAAAAYRSAAEELPSSLVALLGAARVAARTKDRVTHGERLLELANRSSNEPALAAALALRAGMLQVGAAREHALNAAATWAPNESLVAMVQASLTPPSDDVAKQAARIEALLRVSTLASCDTTARDAKAELAERLSTQPAEQWRADWPDPSTLWAELAAEDSLDDVASTQYRAALAAVDNADGLAALDRVHLSAGTGAERIAMRAAFALGSQGNIDEAVSLLAEAAPAPHSWPLAEARAELLAAAGRWEARAQLLEGFAANVDDSALAELSQARAAAAWEDASAAALSAMAELGDSENAAEARELANQHVTRILLGACNAWEALLERTPDDQLAHSVSIGLAERTADYACIDRALASAQMGARSPAGATAIGIRRIRLALATGEVDLATSLLGELSSEADADPRRLAMVAVLAANAGSVDDLAEALAEQASRADASNEPCHAATSRLRAAFLWLGGGTSSEPSRARAVQAVQAALEAHPSATMLAELLAPIRQQRTDEGGAADKKAVGGAAAARRTETTGDAFADVVRAAEASAVRGDGDGAALLLAEALELRPNDPLAASTLQRVARSTGHASVASSVALASLRIADETGDLIGKANAYERLARVDDELRHDRGSATLSWESALAAEPSRLSVVRRLMASYLLDDNRWGSLAKMRGLELNAVAPTSLAEFTSLRLDQVELLERDGGHHDETTELLRDLVAKAPANRPALAALERRLRRTAASEELAELQLLIGAWFGDDEAGATFFTRAGETFAELGQLDRAIEAFRTAVSKHAGLQSALSGWRDAALRSQLWLSAAEAAVLEGEAAEDREYRVERFHLAAVLLMDKVLDNRRAAEALRRVLVEDPAHLDAFLRLRMVLTEEADHAGLGELLTDRLRHEPTRSGQRELHRALGDLYRGSLADNDEARHHYRSVLESSPRDASALAVLGELAWQAEAWAEAASVLTARTTVERNPDQLRPLFLRLGMVYADHLNDPPAAIAAYQQALAIDPSDVAALDRLAELAVSVGDYPTALSISERLISVATDPDDRVAFFHRVARVFQNGMGDRKRAERAYSAALDGAPSNEVALAELVRFYLEAGDVMSIRVQVNRVAGAMRARLAGNLLDGTAARILSRAIAARAAAGVQGSDQVARAAAELAAISDAAGGDERAYLNAAIVDGTSALLPSEVDSLLLRRDVPVDLRQLLARLSDRLAKYVGFDLRTWGLTKSDKLTARARTVEPIVAVAQEVATTLELGDVDVYIAARHPGVAITEQTSPLTLIVGADVAALDAPAQRFVVAGALAIARLGLAVPARMTGADAGALVVGLLRLFQPEFPIGNLDAELVSTHVAKLRRLIPSSLLSELRPFALAIDVHQFQPQNLVDRLRAAADRAGLVAAGSLAAGIRARAGSDRESVLRDPVPAVAELVDFAISDDYGIIAGNLA